MTTSNEPHPIKEYTIFGQATDATSMSMKGFEDLSSLLKAIKTLAISNPEQAANLANIGEDMAKDLFCLVDSFHSEFKRQEG